MEHILMCARAYATDCHHLVGRLIAHHDSLSPAPALAPSALACSPCDLAGPRSPGPRHLEAAHRATALLWEAHLRRALCARRGHAPPGRAPCSRKLPATGYAHGRGSCGPRAAGNGRGGRRAGGLMGMQPVPFRHCRRGRREQGEKVRRMAVAGCVSAGEANAGLGLWQRSTVDVEVTVWTVRGLLLPALTASPPPTALAPPLLTAGGGGLRGAAAEPARPLAVAALLAAALAAAPRTPRAGVSGAHVAPPAAAPLAAAPLPAAPRPPGCTPAAYAAATAPLTAASTAATGSSGLVARAAEEGGVERVGGAGGRAEGSVGCPAGQAGLQVGVSLTPATAAPFLLRAVPVCTSDDRGAMLCASLAQHRPQQAGRWVSRTVLDHRGVEAFVMRTRWEAFVMRTRWEAFVMRTRWEAFVMRTRWGAFVMRTRWGAFVMRTRWEAFVMCTRWGRLSCAPGGGRLSCAPVGGVCHAHQVGGVCDAHQVGSVCHAHQVGAFVMRTRWGAFVMRTRWGAFVMRTRWEAFVMRTRWEAFVMRTRWEAFVMRTSLCHLRPYLASFHFPSPPPFPPYYFLVMASPLIPPPLQRSGGAGGWSYVPTDATPLPLTAPLHERVGVCRGPVLAQAVPRGGGGVRSGHGNGEKEGGGVGAGGELVVRYALMGCLPGAAMAELGVRCRVVDGALVQGSLQLELQEEGGHQVALLPGRHLAAQLEGCVVEVAREESVALALLLCVAIAEALRDMLAAPRCMCFRPMLLPNPIPTRTGRPCASTTALMPPPPMRLGPAAVAEARSEGKSQGGQWGAGREEVVGAATPGMDAWCCQL
ncbi:unnamed protein product [Closterium sp. NIES-64]|nr:unnamed protein product [Closterium sp. NIES-64]